MFFCILSTSWRSWVGYVHLSVQELGMFAITIDSSSENWLIRKRNRGGARAAYFQFDSFFVHDEP